ncbi:MAG: nucleoside triphosphate pyrophosphatase [Dongiaceae bacterium]
MQLRFPLLLASASPRRLELLRQIAITPAEVRAADIDETPHRRELPRTYAIRLAEEKAKAVSAPGHLILAADTVVAAGRRILPKPENETEVQECLELLSGRRHKVYTAIALLAPHGKMHRRMGEAVVSFKKLTAKEITAYIKTGEGIGKAGGYGIQGQAASFIKFISGSYSAIVGLPLFELAQLLHPYERHHG